MDQTKVPALGPPGDGEVRPGTLPIVVLPPVAYTVVAALTADLVSGRYCGGFAVERVTFGDMARQPGPYALLIACIAFAAAGAAIAASRVTETALLGPAKGRSLAVRKAVGSARLLAGAIALAVTVAIPWVSRVADRRAAIAALAERKDWLETRKAMGLLERDASAAACRALVRVALDLVQSTEERANAIRHTRRCADAEVPARALAESPAAEVRAAAAVALRARRKHADALSALERLRRDPDTRVRVSAGTGEDCFIRPTPACTAAPVRLPDAAPRR